MALTAAQYRKRQVRQMIREGASCAEARAKTGAGSTEIAMQRRLLIAAGYAIEDAGSINTRSARIAGAASNGQAPEAEDLCTIFSSRPSRKQVRYWMGGDE